MFQNDIEKSLEILDRGGVILYPTDTVWGIGCDATNKTAVERIFSIKQRNEAQAMLTLVDGLDMLSGYVEKIPDVAVRLMNEATRPLSIIYPKAKKRFICDVEILITALYNFCILHEIHESGYRRTRSFP